MSSGRIGLRYGVIGAMISVTNLRPAPAEAPGLPERFLRWFVGRGWTPRAHQLELLAKARAGRSVLLIAPTGAGKTLAGFLPSLVELSDGARGKLGAPLPTRGEGIGARRERLISTGCDLRREGGLHTLYISPL